MLYAYRYAAQCTDIICVELLTLATQTELTLILRIESLPPFTPTHSAKYADTNTLFLFCFVVKVHLFSPKEGSLKIRLVVIAGQLFLCHLRCLLHAHHSHQLHTYIDTHEVYFYM